MIAGSAGTAACSRSNSLFVLTEMPPDLFQGGTLTGRWIPHNLLCSLPLRNGAKGIKHCVKGRARKQRAESFKIPPAAAYSDCFRNWDSPLAVCCLILLKFLLNFSQALWLLNQVVGGAAQNFCSDQDGLVGLLALSGVQKLQGVG